MLMFISCIIDNTSYWEDSESSTKTMNVWTEDGIELLANTPILNTLTLLAFGLPMAAAHLKALGSRAPRPNAPHTSTRMHGT